MDKNSIGTAVRDIIGELGSSYIGTTIVANAINQAASDLNEHAEYNRVTITMSIKAGGREFVVPTTANPIYSARLGTGSDAKGLEPTSRADLARSSRNWESRVAGTPSKYYTDGRYIGVEPRATAINAWTTGTAYAVGDRVRASTTDNGFIYDCITAGTSSTTEPSWPATIDGTVGDGNEDVVWQQAGSTRLYLRVLKQPDALSNGTAVPSWLPNKFHYSIARGAAIELLGGFDSENPAVDRRLARQEAAYARDVRKLRLLSTGRANDHIGRITLRYK